MCIQIIAKTIRVLTPILLHRKYTTRKRKRNENQENPEQEKTCTQQSTCIQSKRMSEAFPPFVSSQRKSKSNTQKRVHP